MNRFALALAAAFIALSAPLPALAQAFPVTIQHFFGETTIPAAPKRVLAMGWITPDAVVALGVAPIAIPMQRYGGNEDAVSPWLAEAIARQGMALPERIDFDTDIPFEQVLALDPDLILAPYSALTKEEYERLSAIAPTVAYKTGPWSGTWQDITLTVGEALGRKDAAQALIDQTDAGLAAQAAAHPEFKGKTFAFGATWAGEPGLPIYVATDPRVQMMQQLGFTMAPGVAALPTDQNFYVTVSYENLGALDADVFVSWDGGTPEDDAVFANPLVERYRPIAEHHHLRLTDESFVLATSAPSVLSIPWSTDRLVPALSDLLK